MRYFRLYNVRYGETIAVISLDEALLNPEQGILDPETHRLIMIGGCDYTLHPIADISQQRLTNIYEALQDSKKCDDLLHMLTATDALTKRVQELFEPIEYMMIRAKEDLAALITPNKYPNHEPTVELRYADIVVDIVNKSGVNDAAKDQQNAEE